MNKFKTNIFFLFIFLNSFSQEKSNLILEYDINYNLGIPVKKSGILQIIRNKSIFKVSTNGVESKLTLQDDGTYSKVVTGMQGDYADFYFIDFGESSFTLKEHILGKSYIVKRGLHKIDWKITNKTKKIGSFNCQMAIGKFRGRTYNAWFTTKIPIRSGPWKLYGLPGLILEATDSLKQVQFLMKSIKTISTTLNFKGLKGGEEITFEEYVKKKKNFKKDLTKRINSKIPREIRGSTIISKSKGLETFEEPSK